MNALKQSAWRLIERAGFAPLYYRFHQWRAVQAAAKPPPADEDGVPIPPASLIYLVVASTDWRAFVATAPAVKVYADACDRNGGDFAGAQRILDLGCGCGRLARHLPKFTRAEIHGADTNARLVRWCAANLNGVFTVNRNLPPLDYPDAWFDIVYLHSVFTHQRLATQNAWLGELRRIIRPGGLALVTFHDEGQRELLQTGVSADDVVRRGHVVVNDRAEGSNFMAAFQSRKHTREQFASFFEVAEIVGSEASGLGQALAVLRRQSAAAPEGAAAS